MNAYQSKIKEVSQDPDYAGIKLTPEIIIKAMIPKEESYANKKVGFEKGEDLAHKFSFDQEYFDIAQSIVRGTHNCFNKDKTFTEHSFIYKKTNERFKYESQIL